MLKKKKKELISSAFYFYQGLTLSFAFICTEYLTEAVKSQAAVTLVYKHLFQVQCGSCHPQVFSINGLLYIISLASEVIEICPF